jgi:urea transport system permease protein
MTRFILRIRQRRSVARRTVLPVGPLLAFFLALWTLPATAQSPDAFSEALGALPQASFSDKEQIVGDLLKAGHPQTRVALAAFLEGNLVADASGKVWIISDGAVTDPLTGAAAAGIVEADLSKIGTNNRLRKVLKGAIAQFDLSSPDEDVRIAAIREMRRDVDDSIVALMRARLEAETSDEVRDEIAVVLALADTASADAAVRLQAVQTLGGALDPEIHNRLTELMDAEADPAVRAAAAISIRKIERSRKFYEALETLFFGLSLGSVLVLAAIGLTITFGVMGVINMAHGELIMIGAYTTYVIQLMIPQNIGLSILLSIPAAFLVSGLFGIAIERGIVRHLYGRPLETLLATFGLSLILQQLVRSVFSPLNRSVKTPEFMSGSLQINEVFSLTYNRLYIVIFALIVFALLMLLLNRTSLGLKVRAVSQNRAMAKAMGIRTERIDALTFGLGSGIAGVAGVALSQLTNVGPNLGQAYIIDSFMVVVFGGVGNLWGTLISGMSLGVINKLLEPWAGAVMAKIIVLIFLILFIQRKPRGLFPQKGRSAEGH